MTIEFKHLKMQAWRIFFEINDDRPKESVAGVKNLIGSIRTYLNEQDTQVGVWEAEELNNADDALQAGFPKLALIAAIKSMAVSQLAGDAYTFGLARTRGRSVSPRDVRELLKKATASDLLANQKSVAIALYDSQEDAAQAILSLAEATATELLDIQQDTARVLVAENEYNAARLAKSQESALERIRISDTASEEVSRYQAQVVSWMTGGYSIDESGEKDLAKAPYNAIVEGQRNVAVELRRHQDEAAETLKSVQLELAAGLKAVADKAATHLIHTQQNAAMALVEKQTVQAQRKKGIDEADASRADVAGGEQT